MKGNISRLFMRRTGRKTITIYIGSIIFLRMVFWCTGMAAETDFEAISENSPPKSYCPE